MSHPTQYINGVEHVEIDCKVRYRSKAALQIDVGKDDPVWIPLSQIEDEGYDAKGEIYSITIPTWLADEKGLT